MHRTQIPTESRANETRGRCRPSTNQFGLPGPLGAILAGAAAAAALALPAHALEGALSGNLGPGTYRITDDIWVNAGQTLSLAAGTTFEFEDDFFEEYEFDVYGTLRALGTATQPITFRRAPGVPEFNYIKLLGPGSLLQHCVVDGVGSVALVEEGGLWIAGSDAILEDCTIRNATWHGVWVTDGAQATLRRVLVQNCAADGISCASGAGLTALHCRAVANGGDGICVDSGENVLVGCLSANNGEDGFDCRGISPYAATVIHSTFAGSGSEDLSDGGAVHLYNSIVAGSFTSVAECVHSYMMDDVAFFRFVNPAAGNYRLEADSPCREQGTPFGPVAGWLPSVDLDGNPRKNGLLDLGPYEATGEPDLGDGGYLFSRNLVRPRLTQPEIRIPGETFEIWLGLTGTFTPADFSAQLQGADGLAHPLQVVAVGSEDLDSGSELPLQLHTPGLERLQILTTSIPTGTPADFYDLQVSIGTRTFSSIHALRVLSAYPEEWKVVHISDTHVGYDAEEFTAAERFRAFVREANFLDPDFVAVTGDICEDQNRAHGAWVDSFLTVAAELRMPIVITPGNHDHYNQGEANNPYGYLAYFQRMNRFTNSEFRFGNGRLYLLNSGHDHGLLQLYRCNGPTDPALDWLEDRLGQLGPEDFPRLVGMHGPNYDYFSYNVENTGRVRDLIDAYGIDLAIAGHTHRFETFRNEGDNWFGRNDYEHEHDWERDVPFPGYPLHVQTSSLGKAEHLEVLLGPALQEELHRHPHADPQALESHHRGLFGDDIGYRWIPIRNGEVAWFTADTDGDGYRNTEDGWLLGNLTFTEQMQPAGVIVSTVINSHHEDWHDVHHWIRGDAGVMYQAEGGELLRILPDGTCEVAVAELPAGGTSVVTLTPLDPTAVVDSGRWARPLAVTVNPFAGGTTFRLQWSAHEDAAAERGNLAIFDVGGRRVRSWQVDGMTREVPWNGRDEQGRPLAPGAYFARLQAGERSFQTRIVKLD